MTLKLEAINIIFKGWDVYLEESCYVVQVLYKMMSLDC